MSCNVSLYFVSVSGVPVRVVPAHIPAEVHLARRAARRGPHVLQGKTTNKNVRVTSIETTDARTRQHYGVVLYCMWS